MLDYLIVGSGLAGISFAETLERNYKSFKVISDNSQTSSIVAGGIINPVILKRFTLAWKAEEQLSLAVPFYKNLEENLGVRLYRPLSVLRRFVSIEEQNLWFEASDKSGLEKFLSSNIRQNINKCIDAPLGYGEVLQTARLDTKKMIEVYRAHLLKRGLFLQETFDFGAFHIEDECVVYKGIKSRQIVFCEGFGLKRNPYFNYLPLIGNKGEYVFVRASDLKETNCIKSAIFCIPEGDDIYRIGANYERDDKTNLPTQEAKVELLKKWESVYKCPYKVLDHVAGVRPTVIDRRPLVGQHPNHGNLYVLNGFGSRGLMISPYASEQLFQFIEVKAPIDPEMDISRFVKKHKTI